MDQAQRIIVLHHFTWSQNPSSATMLASGEGMTHTITITVSDGNGEDSSTYRY